MQFECWFILIMTDCIDGGGLPIVFIITFSRKACAEWAAEGRVIEFLLFQ